jgi:hypothetical protein
MKKIKKIKSAWYFLGARNYYQGIDKPNIWQWLYTWRIGPCTAWNLASNIWN